MVDLADIHCHLLPYVDDGAEDLSISLQLIAFRGTAGSAHDLRHPTFERRDVWKL
jgi:tyrosine-protein phosphatase YwqE